jgi:peroxiredoxin
MARTESVMTPLGSIAPAFSLAEVTTGKTLSLENVRGKQGLLVMFLCRHCPFVKHLEQGIAQLGREYQDKGVGMVAISSNDAAAYPADGPEGLKEQAQQLGFVFPYLYDETQAVARAYEAACTPDFFLFDKDLKLVYRGQFDESRPGNSVPVTGKDLRTALDALLLGRPISEEQRPSLGCNIKWK